jgi:hypothetical protein
LSDIDATHCTIDLNSGRYDSSLAIFRMHLNTVGRNVKFLSIAVRTPKLECVELRVRSSDAYVVAFHGTDSWYFFDDQPGVWGSKPCGIRSNYSSLGIVGTITYDDLKNLGKLSDFRKGKPIEKRLIAILIAITSEAARFATVATYFVGLTNSVSTQFAPYLVRNRVDFEYLKHNYFRYWAKPPDEPMEVGITRHFAKGEILLTHKG